MKNILVLIAALALCEASFAKTINCTLSYEYKGKSLAAHGVTNEFKSTENSELLNLSIPFLASAQIFKNSSDPFLTGTILDEKTGSSISGLSDGSRLVIVFEKSKNYSGTLNCLMK